MDTESKISIVIQFIKEYFECPNIGPDDDLVKTVPLDSIRALELVMFLEQKFNIQLPLKSISAERLKTPRHVAELVEELT